MLKPLAIAFALTCSAGSLHAAGVLEPSDIEEIVESMATGYQSGKAAGMRTIETQCWNSKKEVKEGRQDVLAYCGVLAFTGHLIEDMQAEKSGKPLPAYWNEDTVTDRIAEQAVGMRLKSEEIEQVLADEIVGKADLIARALEKKGYTY